LQITAAKLYIDHSNFKKGKQKKRIRDLCPEHRALPEAVSFTMNENLNLNTSSKARYNIETIYSSCQQLPAFQRNSSWGETNMLHDQLIS
jgi:hypothetical protein